MAVNEAAPRHTTIKPASPSVKGVARQGVAPCGGPSGSPAETAYMTI